jgi:hypothetical protein
MFQLYEIMLENGTITLCEHNGKIVLVGCGFTPFDCVMLPKGYTRPSAFSKNTNLQKG